MKLPRFRIEDTTDLMRDLTSLGVNHVATSGEADLGNMVSRNLVHLSQFTCELVTSLSTFLKNGKV